MVLVDTSVWIDFFRKNYSLESQVLQSLVENEQEVAICGLIRQEVLQGVRDDVTFRRIKNLLDQTHYLSLKEPDSFDHAAEIFRNLRRRGITLRSPMDCLIAAVAIQSNSVLLHRDSDFMEISKHSGLRLFGKKM
jgi:predicted nucleic acid-binding protein